MSSKGASKTAITRPRRNNSKPKVEKNTVAKRSAPRKKKADSSALVKTPRKKKSPLVLKTPKSKRIQELSASSSTASDLTSTPVEQKQDARENSLLITPKIMKSCLNAYKSSPDYQDLKNKRFNTSFLREIPRGERDIEIFTPEENNSPRWTENLPVIRNKICGVPGQKYADAFKAMPDLDWSFPDLDAETKPKEGEEANAKNVAQKKKRGRPRSVGYKGVPLPDECLLVDYTGLFDSP